jgi:hypothetical protein
MAGSARRADTGEKRLLTLKNVCKIIEFAISPLRLNTSLSQKGLSRTEKSETRQESCSTDSGVHAYQTLYRAIPAPARLLPFIRLSCSPRDNTEEAI